MTYFALKFLDNHTSGKKNVKTKYFLTRDVDHNAFGRKFLDWYYESLKQLILASFQ